MKDLKIQALKEMTRAVNAGDAHAYAQVYAEDAVITIHGGEVLRGRPVIEQYEVGLLREYPGTRFALYAMWQDGSAAVVRYGVKTKIPNGPTVGHEGLLFYRFQPSGLIANEIRYLDSTTPMAQLGMFGIVPVRPAPTLPSQMQVFTAKSGADADPNIALVWINLKALNSRDEAGFLATFARDSIIDEMIGVPPDDDHEGIRSWFRSWATAVPDAKWEVSSMQAVGDYVFVESILSGTLKGTWGRFKASNQPISVHRASIYQIKNRRIVSLTNFMNGKELSKPST